MDSVLPTISIKESVDSRNHRLKLLVGFVAANHGLTVTTLGVFDLFIALFVLLVAEALVGPG